MLDSSEQVSSGVSADGPDAVQVVPPRSLAVSSAASGRRSTRGSGRRLRYCTQVS